MLASYPLPACFLGHACRPLLYILSILHSVHIDAAGLQVDLQLSELQTAKDVPLPKIPECLSPRLYFLAIPGVKILYVCIVGLLSLSAHTMYWM